jgi:hypothetical protein
MATSAALAACVVAVATHYGVPKARLEGVLNQSSSAPTIGVAHIPSTWSPILSHYGFKIEDIRNDPCESVAAAGWILRYMADVQRVERNALKPLLPARALVWQPLITAYSQAAHVDPRLVNAVILQESRFRPDALSPAGAYGLMQLTPDTAKMLGVNRYDVRQNLWGGIWYLSVLQKVYGGNLALTLAAYNAGPSAVSRWHGIPPYRETQSYVPAVMAHYSRLLQVAQTNSAAPIVDTEGQ